MLAHLVAHEDVLDEKDAQIGALQKQIQSGIVTTTSGCCYLARDSQCTEDSSTEHSWLARGTT